MLENHEADPGVAGWNKKVRAETKALSNEQNMHTGFPH